MAHRKSRRSRRSRRSHRRNPSHGFIAIPGALQERLSHWHGSMGDPIYSVASMGGGTKETIERALTSLARARMQTEVALKEARARGEKKYVREYEKNVRHANTTIRMLERYAR